MQAIANDFPFVAALPKREKGNVAKMWDLLKEMRQTSATEGQLLPTRFAAKLIGVSQQRVDQLMDSGKLMRIDVDGHPFVTENSLVAFAKSERAAGRPPNHPKTNRDLFKIGMDMVNEK
jgi:hypothetical protein